MPWSVAMARVRNACHGSVTTTAVDHRWLFICDSTAAMLLNVSLPEPTATTRSAGTPCWVSQILPAEASVNRSPVRLPPTVMMRGATWSFHRSRACTSRAVNTEDGRPSNCAAPSTTIVSETRRSSWRANHQTRPAVTTSTSRTSTIRATAALRASRSAVKRSPAVAAVRHEHGATGLQSRHRDTERRARHVVEPHVVEEVHRRGVAAVLAADTELEVRLGLTTLLGTDPHQRAHPVDVDRLERRDPEDPLLQVRREEGGLDVVAGEAPGGLGEVVGAEGEEVGGLGDLPGRDGGPGQLDHRADQVLDVDALALADLVADALGLLADQLELLHRVDQRDHDFDDRVAAGLLPLGGGLDDGAHLHREQAGHHDPQPHAA